MPAGACAFVCLPFSSHRYPSHHRRPVSPVRRNPVVLPSYTQSVARNRGRLFWRSGKRLVADENPNSMISSICSCSLYGDIDGCAGVRFFDRRRGRLVVTAARNGDEDYFDSPEKFLETSSLADFVRFRRDSGVEGARLQTAVVSYRKRFPWGLLRPFLQVDLVSTIHIADKDYFKTLQNDLESYDCVLYEMVTSKDILENRRNMKRIKRLKPPRSKGFNILGCIQRQMARFLILDFQLDCLDYQSPKWIHADLDFETFKRLQMEKGESFFSFARDMTLKSTKSIMNPSVPTNLTPWKSTLLKATRVLPMPLVALFIIVSVCNVDATSSPNLVLEALSTLDFAAATKIFLAKQLTTEFAQVTSEIEEKSVIIGERNRVAVEALRKAIDDGNNKIAILYGGGHMPDLGRRITAEFDLVPSRVEWITAWTIKKRWMNTDSDSFPILKTMADASGWPLNRYQTAALLIFSAVLAADLLFWEFFFGSTINYISSELARGEDSRGDYSSLSDTRLHESRTYRVNGYALGCAVLASANSILLGYDIGVMSGAVIYIRENLRISATEVEILVGCLNVCSLLGSLISGTLADALGRRATIFVATNTFLLGAILMAFAPSFGFLIGGRVVSGIGVGCSLTTSPLYTSEISPGSTRGLLSSFPEIFINIGILLGYISIYTLADFPESLNWRLMLVVAALPALLVSVTVLFLPESPRWLVLNCRVDEAKRVITLTDTGADADALVRQMINADVDGGGWGEILLHPSSAVKRMMITAVGINVVMQASGNDAVVYYTPQALMDAGVCEKRTLLGITVLMGVTKTIVCVASALCLDRLGRRPLLLLSCAGMGLSLGLLGLGTKYLKFTGGQSFWAVTLCVVAICADFSFFSLGLGPITWVYSSEIFPTRIRAVGTCVAVSVNRIVSGVLSMTFLSFANLISFGGMFFVFAGVVILGFVFVYVLVPETKGKTLEEIAGIFGYEEVSAN